MAKTVLVTGGAGFIGSHVVEGYLKKGYEVVIADNLVSGSMKNIRHLLDQPKVFFYQTDIKSREGLEKIFERHKPAVINHHAAQKSVPASVEKPVYDLETNLLGLLNLIEMTRTHKIENFIYISSGGALSKEITGDEISVEDDYPQLSSPYAVTKFAGENYIKIYSKIYGFGYTVLRYGNVFGPRQIADGECGVIPIFVNNILANRPSVLMTYDDMPRGCSRDYIFVSDVADVNVLVSEKARNDTFNISSGREEYILDIYDQIADIFGSDQKITVQGPRPGDVKRSVLNISKARKELNWEPKVTLKEGIRILRDHPGTTGII